MKIVTSATMKPPMPPTSSKGVIADMLSGPVYRLQVYMALTMISSSRIPVLLTVPLSVIAWSLPLTTRPLPMSRKVFWPRAGLPLRMGVSG